MRTALIGHTGLVGGNLVRQAVFTDCYNSRNIEAIAGQSFDLVACAGAPAVKWLANQEPKADWENLKRLMRCIETVNARTFVLFSTVDVFPNPVEVDEYSRIDEERQQPYGRHRFQLERFVAERFVGALIIRLPGLFGPGLKKNVIFDLLHGNNLQAIDARARFQFYDLHSLWRDVGRFLDANIPLVHVATEPVTVGEIAEHAFGIRFTQTLSPVPATYDFHSRHAARFGGSRGYLYDRNAVLHAMRNFVSESRSAHATGNLQPGVAA